MTATDQNPAPAGSEPPPWARDQARTDPPVTSRLRRRVDGLPEWDPLPPGEILVQRGGHG